MSSSCARGRGRGLWGVVLGRGLGGGVGGLEDRCLAIQAFTVTTKWSCHLAIRHVEQ
jgi:hypothetical protein